VQSWEGELQRAYILHKARTIYEGAAARQQAPAAPVPAYLSARDVMPSVDIWDGAADEAEATSGKRARQGQEGVASFYGGFEVEGEEMNAMVGFVVKDFAAELYTEFLAGLPQ
jgi:hypothetical protein